MVSRTSSTTSRLYASTTQGPLFTVNDYTLRPSSIHTHGFVLDDAYGNVLDGHVALVHFDRSRNAVAHLKILRVEMAGDVHLRNEVRAALRLTYASRPIQHTKAHHSH